MEELISELKQEIRVLSQQLSAIESLLIEQKRANDESLDNINNSIRDLIDEVGNLKN